MQSELSGPHPFLYIRASSPVRSHFSNIVWKEYSWADDVVKVANLFGNLDDVGFALAAFSGQMGACPDEFPICIKFNIGLGVTTYVQFMGVKVACPLPTLKRCCVSLTLTVIPSVALAVCQQHLQR